MLQEANVPILYPLKTPDNYFFGVFRGYNIEILVRNFLRILRNYLLIPDIETKKKKKKKKKTTSSNPASYPQKFSIVHKLFSRKRRTKM